MLLKSDLDVQQTHLSSRFVEQEAHARALVLKSDLDVQRTRLSLPM